jgi:hypothetical protein
LKIFYSILILFIIYFAIETLKVLEISCSEEFFFAKIFLNRNFSTPYGYLNKEAKIYLQNNPTFTFHARNSHAKVIGDLQKKKIAHSPRESEMEINRRADWQYKILFR